jgi:hypothetical protein
MDSKKIGAVIIAIGVAILIGCGVFYAANIDEEPLQVAFMAGPGTRQNELLHKMENRAKAKRGFFSGTIVTIFGLVFVVADKGSDPKKLDG